MEEEAQSGNKRGWRESIAQVTTPFPSADATEEALRGPGWALLPCLSPACFPSVSLSHTWHAGPACAAPPFTSFPTYRASFSLLCSFNSLPFSWPRGCSTPSVKPGLHSGASMGLGLGLLPAFRTCKPAVGRACCFCSMCPGPGPGWYSTWSVFIEWSCCLLWCSERNFPCLALLRWRLPLFWFSWKEKKSEKETLKQLVLYRKHYFWAKWFFFFPEGKFRNCSS